LTSKYEHDLHQQREGLADTAVENLDLKQRLQKYQQPNEKELAETLTIREPATQRKVHRKCSGRFGIRVHACHNLRNRDTGLFGDVSDPFVEVVCGEQRVKTSMVMNNLNPTWEKDNYFMFDVDDHDHVFVEVHNGGRFTNSLGTLKMPFEHFGPSWTRRKMLLDNIWKQGELEFEVMFLPSHSAAVWKGALDTAVELPCDMHPEAANAVVQQIVDLKGRLEESLRLHRELEADHEDALRHLARKEREQEEERQHITAKLEAQVAKLREEIEKRSAATEALTSKYENEIHQQREALADMALQSSFLRQHLDGEERNHDEEDQGDLGRTTSGSRGLRESDVATTTSEQPALSEVHNFYSCTFSE